MAPQLYLITPATADLHTASATVAAVLNAATFSALLVQRGSLDDAAYAKLATELVAMGQAAGCAVLVENNTALAKKIGADGVHVTEGPVALKAAIAAIKPSMIVGAGNLATRHDAMTVGEMNVDYVFFGPLAGASDTNAADLAEWWATTFEIPAVLSDPAASPTTDTRGAEFLALSTSIWSAADPVAATATIVDALGAA
ncbi:thiamine phosphate synthase [Devosia sp. BSSL-BM10]|uniref:Thiamine phosphate synthase n=1 Tax=Devosia litorisediminis TaxID=2829817 RepID=A0A942IC02_9HYPH|nr:thiamine phosphate synthase [Devosia litorisediminis]MBS3847224.1 thiamine phosphate synthase [Devosia litorisediminis]